MPDCAWAVIVALSKAICSASGAATAQDAAGAPPGPDADVQPDEPADQPQAEAAQQPQAEVADQPLAEPSFWSSWTGSVELGLNGSSGNTERFNVRGGASAKRSTERMETTLSASFSYATENSDETENRLRGEARNDWLLPDSRWRVFVLGSAEYDEFQDWDLRLSAFGGAGYELVTTERTFVLGRLGVGLTREIGGTENAIMPEGLLGLDVEHQLTERQRVFGSAEFLPKLDDVGPYRFLGRAGWEILIDPESNLSLKVGLEDRYDSSPGEGFRRNDVDYFVVLVWSF